MPRLSSVQRADGSFVSKPLEDLWPFLDREEFRSNMLVPVAKE
jgi:acetolactate synthase-1/2/3 large subunit